jgi:hypothetical protein
MTTEFPQPLAVIGADLDLPLLQALSLGDSVMLEMNGTRVGASAALSAACPLVVEQPWQVVGNDSVSLRLKHPKIIKEIELPYNSLLQNYPGVFKFVNSAHGTTGPIFAIVQFVGHWMNGEELYTTFPNSFNEKRVREAIEDDSVREALLERWEKLFGTFSVSGFGYKSVKRLALRSRVAESVLRNIRNGIWQDISDDQMVAIHEAVSWLPHLLRCSGMIHHDEVAEYDPTTAEN